MPRFQSIQNSFVSGELSPLLRGRTDIKQYGTGCATLLNFTVMKHGGVRKRSGTRFVAGTKSNGAARLVEFQFNDEQGYALEFGNLYIRFFRYDGSGVPGQLEASVGTPTEIVSPWASADIAGLKFAQSNDTLYILHKDYAPRRLRRTSASDHLVASWTLEAMPYEDGPYEPINTTATTITSSGTTGSVTLTASAALFASTDVGRWVRVSLGSPATWGAAQITAYTDTTHVTATILASMPFASTSASSDWRLGSWHSGTSGGSHWPSVAVFHNSRLWLGATEAEPQRLWASEVDDFDSFAPSEADFDVLDENAIDVKINDNRANALRWLVSDRVGLLCLTSGGEFVMAGPNDAALTPGNTTIRRHSSRGANALARPVQAGVSTLFFQTDRKLRELAYQLSSDRLDGPDLAVLSEHITEPGVEETAYLETPESELWVLFGDGTLASIALERDQQVVGWSRCEFSGTGAEVESVAVVRYDGVDALWVIVKRTIDGGTKRYVEVMQPKFDHDIEAEDAWFVDSGLKYDSTATDTITGLDHLEGETVAVLADGCTVDGLEVASGEITLPFEASVVVVGLPIESEFEPMPLISQQAPFDVNGSLRRAIHVDVQFWRSLGGSIASVDNTITELDNTYPIPWRTTGDNMDEAPPLATETYRLTLGMQHDRDPSFRITHDEPQPCHILSCTTLVEVAYGG